MKLDHVVPNSAISLHVLSQTHPLARTQLVKITVRKLDDILNTNSTHIIVRWTGTYNFLMHQSSAFKFEILSFMMYKMQLTLVTGPLVPHEAKHESESTYICIDNTRISEKTFFVPLRFGGYLLTIETVRCRSNPTPRRVTATFANRPFDFEQLPRAH